MVLIADPDASTREELDGALAGAAIAAAGAADGRTALRLFYSERPAAVAVALELPGVSGWEVLATIRELSDVPVLILAGEDTETTRVRALRAGADDFVGRPFRKAEIVARLEALLRRRRTMEEPERFADEYLRIDHGRHAVEALGSEVSLTPTEFKLLSSLARHAGQVLSHAQLLSMVWGDVPHDRREVKLYVSYLRRKLRAAGLEPVETVRGIGYRYRPRPLGDDDVTAQHT